jgi:beta-N-acetylhexosaminidase
MDLERALGQLFVVGVEVAGARVTDVQASGAAVAGAAGDLDHALERAFADDPLGGFILFQRNLHQDLAPAVAREAMARALAGARARSEAAGHATPFLMIDHEGGRVHRLEGSATRFPPPGRLSALAPERVAAVCRQQADELRAIGFNTILGPVLDVCPATGTASHIGPRSYSGDPQLAAELGALAVRAFMERGILPVPKHFPGYGAAPVDPHLDLPTRTDPLEDLVARDLLPYERAVAAGCPAIMTAHIVATCLDPALPCTLSAAWLGHLRRELGFAGCLVSDDLCMASVKDRYGLAELAELTLRAGLDVLLVCHPGPGAIADTRRHLAAVAGADPAFRERVDEALARVAAARRLFDEGPPAPPLDPDLFARGEALRVELAEQGVTW